MKQYFLVNQAFSTLSLIYQEIYLNYMKQLEKQEIILLYIKMFLTPMFLTVVKSLKSNYNLITSDSIFWLFSQFNFYCSYIKLSRFEQKCLLYFYNINPYR